MASSWSSLPAPRVGSARPRPALWRTRRARSAARPQCTSARRVADTINAAPARATPYAIDLANAERHRRDKRADQRRGRNTRHPHQQCRRRPLALPGGDHGGRGLAMIEVPYLAAFNLTRTFLPEMIARRSRRDRLHHLARLLCRLAELRPIAARRALPGFPSRFSAELRGPAFRDAGRARRGRIPYWQHNPGSREHMPKSNPPRAGAHARTSRRGDRSGG